MHLIVSGMLTKQISSILGTTEITVTVQHGQVMRKMEANSPAELGRMAERLKLPTAPLARTDNPYRPAGTTTNSTIHMNVWSLVAY